MGMCCCGGNDPVEGIQIREFWSRIGYHIICRETDQWYEKSSLELELKLRRERGLPKQK